eukprot:3884474-Karenia_brevis.AAC.1
MEKQKEEKAKIYDAAIKELEVSNKQISEQITSLQPSHLQPTPPPAQGPSTSSSLITPTQIHTMGQKVFTSLYSSNPDPSLVQSFADVINIAAMESGIQ